MWSVTLELPTLIAGDLLMGQSGQFVDLGHYKGLYTMYTKRVHAIKLHSVVTPNGRMANLFGPVEGGVMTEVCYPILACCHSYSNQSFMHLW